MSVSLSQPEPIVIASIGTIWNESGCYQPVIFATFGFVFLNNISDDDPKGTTSFTEETKGVSVATEITEGTSGMTETSPGVVGMTETSEGTSGMSEIAEGTSGFYETP